MNSSNHNPFGLVYEGAITANKIGHVQITPISYKRDSISLSANIYTPSGYTAEKSYPAIVIAHPNGGVKEQVAGLYGQRLAEKGFITLVADAAFQGASEGLPRHTDVPSSRVEDIYGMVDVMSHFPGVSHEHIGALGICGGGGYTLSASRCDKRIKAVATVCMFNTGEVRRNGYMRSLTDSIQTRLQEATQAREKEVLTGEVTYSGDLNFDTLTDEVINKIETDLYREGMQYYGKTHRHPNSTFKYRTSNLMELIAFDATHGLELLTAPLLMIAGEKADSLYMTEEAFSCATNAKEKELVIIPSATHIQLYHVNEYVSLAIEKLEKFFNIWLAK